MTRDKYPPLVVLFATALLLGLSACTPSYPYRTVLNKTLVHCADASQTNSNSCESMTPEVTDHYELYFVEFDDQGWLHPEKDPNRGEAARQLDFLMSKLQEKVPKNNGSPRLSIVLYIHGWKHNAKYDDENVKEFRRVLEATYAAEQAASQAVEQAASSEEVKRKPRDVVGVYVGWRGRSLNVPDLLLDTTFWNRKAAALRVAQGTVRELFARLNGFQRYYDEQEESCKHPSVGKRPQCDVRMILIGHSFGAWILYSAIEESLIAGLAAQNDVDVTNRKAHVIGRFADMIVLINPAFEGSRYEALYRAAHNRTYDHYQAPIFVSITSTADWATRYAFPLGRIFSTLIERPTSSSEQGYAIGHTLGHIERYITHTLTKNDQATSVCPGWKDVTTVPESERAAQMEKNLQLELKNAAAFFSQYSSTTPIYLPPGWKRTFCGGAVLTQLIEHGGDSYPDIPVWNVQTDASLVKNHSDINEVIFSSFLRQLYHDVPQYREFE